MWLNNRKNQSSWRKYRQSAQWQISDHRLQEHFAEIQTHVSLSLPWGNLHVCGLAFQTFEFLLYWSVRRPKFWRSMALSFILSAKLAICCGGGICNIKSIRTQNVTPLPLAASTRFPLHYTLTGGGLWFRGMRPEGVSARTVKCGVGGGPMGKGLLSESTW